MGQDARAAGAAADEIWDIARAMGCAPHEVVGLVLSSVTALRFAATVRRVRLRWRKYQVEELIRSLDGDRDPFGVLRVVALLGMGEIEG